MPAKEGPKAPPIERVQSSYKQLCVAAKNLNAASDELGKLISLFDAALQKFNLGVSAWVEVSGSRDDSTGDWWSRDLGYTRVGNKWGIALRKASGNLDSPIEESEEVWLFNEAPRWMRAEAVGKIPDLLEALVKRAGDTTKKIKERTTQVQELAAAMSKAADEAQPAKEKADARPA
jgi:methyl-accepting chemotaxis protein